jgi:hypothetical protein
VGGLDYFCLPNRLSRLSFCSKYSLQCDNLKMMIVRQEWGCYGFSKGLDRLQIGEFWTDDIPRRGFMDWSFDKQLLGRNSRKRITWHDMNIRSYHMLRQGIEIISKVSKFFLCDRRRNLLLIQTKKLFTSHISLRSLPALWRQFGHSDSVDK